MYGADEDSFEVLDELNSNAINKDYIYLRSKRLGKKTLGIYNSSLYNSLKGKIIVRVEENGEAYYVNPKDGNRYFLGRPKDAFRVMRNSGLGISEDNFNNLLGQEASVSVKDGNV